MNSAHNPELSVAVGTVKEATPYRDTNWMLLLGQTNKGGSKSATQKMRNLSRAGEMFDAVIYQYGAIHLVIGESENKGENKAYL